MTTKLELTGSGRYVVFVNGARLEGEHDMAHKASERASNLALANPGDVVEYGTPDLRIRVRVTGDAPAPAPDPGPAPVIDSVLVKDPLPVPVPGSSVLWQWDARTVAPFGIHAKQPHADRVSLVTVGGRPYVRLVTFPGDIGINGSNAAERCDLRLGNDLSDAREGREWRFKHEIRFPSKASSPDGIGYVDLPQSPGDIVAADDWKWGSAMNWHDDADDGGSQGPLQLMTMPPTVVSPDRPKGLHFQVYGGVGGTRRGDFPIAAIVRDALYELVYHVRWTSTSAGFANGWLNGRQFMKYVGPTLHAGHGAYLKLANYHMPTGEASAILQGAIVRW